MTATSDNQKKSTNGADRRSRLYLLTGHVLVTGFVAVFLAFMVRNFYQNTMWKDYYFKNAHKFGDSCSARFGGGESLDFPGSLASSPLRKIELPHKRGFFDSWYLTASPFYHAEYRCVIDTVPIRFGKGANYIHLGWLFGERIEVVLNNKSLLKIQGEDFISVPVGQVDLAAPTVEIKVRVSSADRHRFGFASIIPPAVTTETKDHLLILGIQPVYEFLNIIQPMIPTMALSILIGLAWFIGIRTRIVLTGMFYFAAELSSDALALLGPYLPLSATKVYTLGLPFAYLNHVAILCLMLEVFGVWRTRIYNIMNVSLAIIAAGILVMLSWDGVFPYSQLVSQILDPVFVVLYLCMFAYWFRMRAQVLASQRKVLFGAAAFLIGAILFRLGINIARHYAWTSQVSIDFYFRFFLQLFVAGLVLFYLSSVESDLLKEKDENKQLQQRLNVGGDLLAIMRDGHQPVRSDIVTLDWQESLRSDAWRASWLTGRGDLVVVQGAIIGTGDQVYAGVIAIQSVLELCRGDRIENPQICFEMINRTIIGLFKKFLRSTATGVVVHRGLSVEICETGGCGVFILGSSAVLNPGGQPLGSSDSIHCEKLTINISKGQTLIFVRPDVQPRDLQLPEIQADGIKITAA